MSRVSFSAYGATAGYLFGIRGFNNLSQGDDEDGARNGALLSTLPQWEALLSVFL